MMPVSASMSTCDATYSTVGVGGCAGNQPCASPQPIATTDRMLKASIAREMLAGKSQAISSNSTG